MQAMMDKNKNMVGKTRKRLSLAPLYKPLMKENAERQELAKKYIKCTRQAKAANESLKTSR